MAQENRHIEFSDESDFLQETLETVQSAPKPAEPVSQKKTDPLPKKKVKLKEIIDGTFLVRENMVRQLPYLLFLTFLGIIYIGNRFHAEKMVRQIEELKVEVGNLRSEQITTASELMNISRPSEVAALVEERGLGLKESLEPPKKLKR